MAQTRTPPGRARRCDWPTGWQGIIEAVAGCALGEGRSLRKPVAAGPGSFRDKPASSSWN